MHRPNWSARGAYPRALALQKRRVGALHAVLVRPAHDVVAQLDGAPHRQDRGRVHRVELRPVRVLAAERSVERIQERLELPLELRPLLSGVHGHQAGAHRVRPNADAVEVGSEEERHPQGTTSSVDVLERVLAVDAVFGEADGLHESRASCGRCAEVHSLGDDELPDAEVWLDPRALGPRNGTLHPVGVLHVRADYVELQVDTLPLDGVQPVVQEDDQGGHQVANGICRVPTTVLESLGRHRVLQGPGSQRYPRFKHGSGVLSMYKNKSAPTTAGALLNVPTARVIAVGTGNQCAFAAIGDGHMAERLGPSLIGSSDPSCVG